MEMIMTKLEQTRADAPVFSCRDLHVRIADTEIVRGVDLDVGAGERHAIMGPNGSGKSTFASALMGHPAYEVTGAIRIDGQDLSALPPHERARRGLFLGFQYPVAVPGVAVAGFLRVALSAVRGEEIPVRAFRAELGAAMEALSVPRSFAGRHLNDGFSGGEKKRLEILQLLLLKPRFALLDEIDSGLDVDALKEVSQGINQAADAGTGVLIVTHYQRILETVRPDKVHVFAGGLLVETGGPELALSVEANGYDRFTAPAAAG
jgi:Fe-S cluster assembly ATP-binding protein